MNHKLTSVYFAPVLHLSVALTLLFALYGLQWSFAGLLWGFLLLLDFPASLPYYVLAWKYGVIAILWVVVAGTAWWYFLSCVVARFVSSRQ